MRSPYAGTIKKIKWLGQTDQVLLVEAMFVRAAHRMGGAYYPELLPLFES